MDNFNISLQGISCLLVQEPDNNDAIFIEKLAYYLLLDNIKCERKYKGVLQYTPQFALILTYENFPKISNIVNTHIPKIQNVWNKIKLISFESQFVMNNVDQNKQYQMDVNLSEDMIHWNQTLMWLLISKYYPIFVDNQFPIPMKMLESATKFKSQYDNIILNFFDNNDSYSITNNEDDFVIINNVYRAFKDWYKETYSKSNMQKYDFIKLLTQNNFRTDKLKLYKVKYENDYDYF
jgi:phage/plasmid-associated DNA primase